MIELSRLQAMLGALMGAGGGAANKITYQEVTLNGNIPGLILFASGSGAGLVKRAIEQASPRGFTTFETPNHSEN